MRAMPYRVASSSSVVFSQPQLVLLGGVFGPDEPVAPWDYLTSLAVRSSVRVIEAEFVRSTGLKSLDGAVAQIQVDCRATGSRHTSRRSLGEGTGDLLLEATIGPHEVADRLEVTHAVLLDLATTVENADMVAYQRGSRLFTEDVVHRFVLEGSAPRFPTEAFAFGPVGLPSEAAWRLRFDPGSLDVPYLGAVRLLVNSEHPCASDLLSGKPSLVWSVLHHSIIEQMLLAVADRFADEVFLQFEPESVGGVLDHLCHLYLGAGLPQAVSGLRDDRAETLCRLQASTGFLSWDTP